MKGDTAMDKEMIAKIENDYSVLYYKIILLYQAAGYIEFGEGDAFEFAAAAHDELGDLARQVEAARSRVSDLRRGEAA